MLKPMSINQRTDTFVVGPLVDGMTIFNMITFDSSVDFNKRFISVGVNQDNILRFPADQLSKSVVGVSHYPIMFFTATRTQPSTVVDGVRTSYYIFKVFNYRAGNQLIGYLGLSDYTNIGSGRDVIITSVSQTLVITTTDPSTFNNEDVLLTGVRYSIGAIAITPCNSVYSASNTPDIPLIEIVNDILGTDIDQDDLANPNSAATTTWCNGVGSVYYTSSASVVFVPVNWYNQGNCQLSWMSSSLLDSGLTLSNAGRYYPPSVYMLQCLAGNSDLYNESRICRSVRALVSYTTSDTCVEYSNIGRFFYGDICGESNYSYPTIFGGSVQANEVVGPCSCDSCKCGFSYNRIQCIPPLTIPQLQDEPPVVNNRSKWRLLVLLIVMAIVFTVLIIVTIIAARL